MSDTQTIILPTETPPPPGFVTVEAEIPSPTPPAVAPVVAGPYYAHYDPTLNPSRVLGWLDYSFHPYNFDPTTIIEITPDLWAKRLDGQYVVLNGAVLIPPAPVLTQAQLTSNAKASLAAIRYTHEITGVSFTAVGASSPSIVASDRDSRSLILTAFVLASATPPLWHDGDAWKMADGTFVPLTSADVIKMSLTVQSYVSACFKHEQTLSAALDKTITAADVAAIDLTAGWPA